MSQASLLCICTVTIDAAVQAHAFFLCLSLLSSHVASDEGGKFMFLLEGLCIIFISSLLLYDPLVSCDVNVKVQKTSCFGSSQE